MNQNALRPDDRIESVELMANNFIKNIVEEDVRLKKHVQIITRFPPEPNGYLHIGHAKSICLNFGLAEEFAGFCNLRFDDTNPEKETQEYVRTIQEDINFLGYQWHEDVKFASDYFDQLYEFAVYFIKSGLAYVCDLTQEQLRLSRGTLLTPGVDCVYRNRSIRDNLDLFIRMKNGEFEDGSKTLRLKIDMSSPNINLRDPVIYRIKHAQHIRTGNKWCIYPMYDYAHCVSDAVEGITHSCCTLEFEDHRSLYEWIISHLYEAKLIQHIPRQIEFSRLELQYTVTSKRKLNKLVLDKYVSGWDDPRMPTISGMARRGYPFSAIKLFVNRCGISKSPNIVDMSLLESSVREVLEQTAYRIMAVLNPLKVILTNFDMDVSCREAQFNLHKNTLGSRRVELTREIYIERDDFLEHQVSGWKRLLLGGEVRLRHSYVIKCDEIIKDATGEIVELHCSIDKNTLGENPVGRKVKGVIHWVSSKFAIKSTVRLYDRLFTQANPSAIAGTEFTKFVNASSLRTCVGYIEPSILQIHALDNYYQFERLGYFVLDKHISKVDALVFNKTVGLKDTWSGNNF